MDTNVRPESMARITTFEQANAFIDEQVAAVREQVGDKKVLLALSGGVDSSVVAALLVEAIGSDNVVGISMPCHSAPKDRDLAKVFCEKYGIRLYEILKSYNKNNREWFFEIDKLKERIDATQACYSNFSNFKKKCLDPAVNEINAYTDINVAYVPEYEGRKVTRIRFFMAAKAKEDPAYYKKFSERIEETIELYRAKRISDGEYLSRMQEIKEDFRKGNSGIAYPSNIHTENSRAFYGVIFERLIPLMKENTNIEQEKMDLYDDSEVALRTLSVISPSRSEMNAWKFSLL